MLTFGFEASLIAFREEDWTEFLAEVDRESILRAETRELRRVIMGGATMIEFDKQGRFVIPEYLRERIRIDLTGDIAFIGQGNYVELWDKKIWNKHQQQSINSLEIIAQSLSRGESK